MFQASMLLTALFVVQMWESIYGGRIYPSSTRQIQSTIGNKLELANYTFGFILSNELKLGGRVEVTFPTQYPASLGFNATNPLLCKPVCVRSGRTVAFSFSADLLPGVGYNVSVYNVLNPDAPGGTGNFWIKSIKGGQVVDENLIFGVIGVANDIGAIKTASVALETEGVQYAGESSKYVFIFTTSRSIPDNNFVRLYLPENEFTVAKFPACAAYPVGGKTVRGRLVCESFGSNYIDVSGFKDKFVPGTSIGIVVTLKNPIYAHITNQFGVAVMRKFTQVMYDRKLDIDGVTITPGRLFNVKVLQVDSAFRLTRNKVMQFSLAFKPTNALPDGSMIKLQFPASFPVYSEQLLGQETMFWVEFGLEDKSEEDSLEITYDEVNDVMKIFNYKPKTVADEIILKFWATTPDNAGESSPIVIKTYTDLTGYNLIDQDTQFAKVTVLDVTAPASFNMDLSEQYAGMNKQVTATFFFTPKVSVPANGFISITFDPNLVVGELVAGSCLIWEIATLSYVEARSCFKRNREISLQLKDEQYTKDAQYSVRLASLIYSPTSSGTFFAEVTMLQADFATLVHSYSQRIAFRPAVFSFPVMSVYPKEKLERAVIDFAFTTPFDVPHSRPQNITTEVVSYIAVGFSPSGPTSLKPDLGYSANFPGYIPCLEIQGLTPVEGSHINCTITTLDSPTVLIRNYQAVPAGTRIRVVISSFENPDGNFIATFSIVKKFNRIVSKIAEHSETFQITSVIMPTPFDKTMYTTAAFYDLNQTEVYQTFELNFNMYSEKSVNGNEKMVFTLPTYDTGFVMEDTPTKCYINELPYTCFSVPKDDTIVIELASFQSVPVASEIFIKLSPLRWPRIEKSFAGPLGFRVVSKLRDTVSVYTYPEFTTATPSVFSRAIISVDKNRRADIDVRYTFTFSNPEEVPAGSTFILTVPTYYNFIATTPAIRVSFPEFVSASPATPLAYFFTSNKLQISNIGRLPRGTTFRVILNGVQNPDTSSVMTSWYAEVTFNEFALIRHSNFFALSLENPGDYSTLAVERLTVFPVNADVLARYTFVVAPKVKLSLGSEIHIQFPEQYKVLPSSPACTVDGGIKTFTKCAPVLNSIVFTLDLDYEVASGPITLVVEDVLNPDRGVTSAFELFTKYDGVTLERTDPAATAGRTLSVSAKPNSITMVDTAFDPQNEGEISTYTFKFLPATDIDINQEIVFFFPRTFDQILGNKLQCVVTTGLADSISCTRLANRVLYIDGVSSYQVSPDRPITIEVQGVINPNKLDTASQVVAMGILRKGDSSLIDYSEAAISVTPIKAPGWAFFFAFGASNTKCRYTADYSLNFTAASSIPKLSSEGAVILDLPRQFGISNEIVPCLSQTPAFGTALNCKVENNRVWITGNTNDYSGEVVLKAKKLRNPIDRVSSDNFIVSTYDGINMKVIERSYENLDPFYLDFDYPGPLIVVNNDEPVKVMRGTQSEPIPISIQNVAALNLTLKPTTTGVSVIPFEVDIQIGQATRYFRVSAPLDLSLGNYTVDWTVEGELVPPIYTPIKTTLVQVLQTVTMNVSVGEVSDIPFGGRSMPVFFAIPRAPDIGFEIKVNFKKSYRGIALSQNLLSFDAGVTNQSFRVYFTDIKAANEEALTSGAIDLQVAGVNKAIYSMPVSSLVFKVITQDVVQPRIAAVVLNDIQKTFVNVTVQASEPCYVYYMVALKGTKVPEASFLSSLGKTLTVVEKANTTNTTNSSNSSNSSNTTNASVSTSNTSNSTANSTKNASNETVDFYQASTRAKFYETYIFDSLSATFLIEGLNPEVEYSLFVVLQDRGSQYSGVTTQDFTTKERDYAAETSIRLKQSYISAYDANKYLQAIALVLSLDPSRVQLSKYDFTKKIASGSRLLQIYGTGREEFKAKNEQDGGTKVDEVTALLSFNILSTIDSELYPAPKNLGQLLNNKTTELNARIDNLDTSYIVPSTDFIKYSPSFVSVPALYTFTYEYAVVSTRMDNYGWLYAVAVERESKTRSKATPSPLQVSLGLDSQNLQVPAGAIEITKTYEFFYLTIKALKPETKYTLFVIGANAHPGYPDLMNDKFMRQIDFTSLKAPEKEFLDLHGCLPSLGLLWLASVLLFL